MAFLPRPEPRFQSRDSQRGAMPFVHKFDIWQRNPGGKKRLLIVRFGAIGDQVQTASVLPLLKEQGYHVTYMTTPEAQQVLLHNPHIDDWIIQDKDQVP